MKVVIVVVQSLDGRITKGDNPDVHDWASEEDWTHFADLRSNSDVVVMGRVTYEQVKPTPEPERLRYVLTDNASKYADQQVEGQLEFGSATPAELMSRFEREDRKQVLVAGGAGVYRAFWEAGLVTDAFFTTEPLVFGEGDLLVDGPVDVQMHLVGLEQLNDRGTVLAHYTVDRSPAMP